MKKSSSGDRHLTERVKTAKKRTASSTRWLERQLNDPYVHRARREGYRSRAAYKLAEMDDRFSFLKTGKQVLDLGAAPGGWTQVAVERTGVPVIAVDILAMSPIPGAQVLMLDFLNESAPAEIRKHLPKGVDVVLSDMAPNTTGHAVTDHLRIMGLLEEAYHFAREILKSGGAFVAKVFQGGSERELLALMKKDFALVKHAKPKASRTDSSEMYVVAMGFRTLSKDRKKQ